MFFHISTDRDKSLISSATGITGTHRVHCLIPLFKDFTRQDASSLQFERFLCQVCILFFSAEHLKSLIFLKISAYQMNTLRVADERTEYLTYSRFAWTIASLLVATYAIKVSTISFFDHTCCMLGHCDKSHIYG